MKNEIQDYISSNEYLKQSHILKYGYNYPSIDIPLTDELNQLWKISTK